jgi:hypothetical protein
LTGREVLFSIVSVEEGVAVINCSMLKEGIFLLKYEDEFGATCIIKLSKQ